MFTDPHRIHSMGKEQQKYLLCKSLTGVGPGEMAQGLSTPCSSQELRLDSQHLCGVSQLSVAPV